MWIYKIAKDLNKEKMPSWEKESIFLSYKPNNVNS
jgi:hypothetical protein